MKLTKSSIDKFKYEKSNGSQDIRWDDALPGFGVRIYPSGKKSFVLFYRVKGRQHMKVVGQYGPLTLEQARDRARKDLADIIDNRDPLERKRRDSASTTFKTLCSEYMEKHAKQFKRTWEADDRRIRQYLVPHFGTMRLEAITKADVSRLYHALVATKPYEANRMIQQLSKMFERASAWGLVPDSFQNPAKGVKVFKEQKRDRWVTHEELPRLAQAINEEKNVYGRAAIWLYLLTGLRRNELLKATWDDVDSNRQELRLPETKAGIVHYIPLSPAAVAVLQQLPRQLGNKYLLPGAKPGSHLVNIEKIWFRIRASAGLLSDDPHKTVRLHDLRRTVGSWLAQSGNTLHLIGRVLNHSSQSTTAIYARFGQNQVREALDSHGEKFRQLIDSDQPEGNKESEQSKSI